ncbi:MAG: hypothetical protein ACI8QP_001531, partial [Porticoccaceae bacterium]
MKEFLIYSNRCFVKKQLIGATLHIKGK